MQKIRRQAPAPAMLKYRCVLRVMKNQPFLSMKCHLLEVIECLSMLQTSLKTWNAYNSLLQVLVEFVRKVFYL